METVETVKSVDTVKVVETVKALEAVEMVKSRREARRQACTRHDDPRHIALWQSCNISEKSIKKYPTLEIDFSVNFHQKCINFCMKVS